MSLARPAVGRRPWDGVLERSSYAELFAITAADA
jgi:hypothetical protein